MGLCLLWALRVSRVIGFRSACPPKLAEGRRMLYAVPYKGQRALPVVGVERRTGQGLKPV